jgi:hypothetical protein
VLEFPKGLGFNLTDALTSNSKDFANFLQGPWLTTIKTEAKL